MENNEFKILTIDGGGIRGIYPAYILNEINKEFEISNFYEEFDLIAGTSTGSIIAAALAIGMSPDEILNFYEEYGEKIFKKNKLNILKLIKSKYTNEVLKETLNHIFKNLTMKNTKTRLLIPATDISNGDVYVHKSYYDEEFERDKDTLISKAVLSSCSAPTYFKPTKINKGKENYLLADGGLWANNPSIIALTEAIGSRLDIKKSQIKILSLGTGIGKNYYDKNTKNWGFYTWGIELINTLLNLQTINNNNLCDFLLEKEQYLRLNFVTDSKLSLDKYDIDFKKKANKILATKTNKIQNFFN